MMFPDLHLLSQSSPLLKGVTDMSFYGSNLLFTPQGADMGTEFYNSLEPVISPHTSLGGNSGYSTGNGDLAAPVLGADAISRLGSTFSSEEDCFDDEYEYAEGIDPQLVVNALNGQEGAFTPLLANQKFASTEPPRASLSVPATPSMKMLSSVKSEPGASALAPKHRGGRKRAHEELSVVEKKAARRAANNRSAHKSRSKKNEVFKQLSEEVPVLKKRVAVLEKENVQLCKEKEELERRLIDKEADLAKWKAKALTKM